MADVELKPGWLRRDVLAASVSAAWDRLRQAKRNMDEAQAVFERAEDEWRQVSLECDRLDGIDSSLPQEKP